MKLGEMLIRDGRITEAQLQEALAVQARGGGRLGTVLVELDLIDYDALTVYLGLELGIPIATGAMLERAKRAAVRLLTPEQAYRFKCVPLVVQDRQLIACLEDPHDFDVLDGIAQLTGYRVIPRVAPEIRVYYYVERYYGIPRPARFVTFGDAPRGQVAPPDGGLPAPPLPGLPPRAVTLINAPTPAPALRRRRATQQVPVDAFEDVESQVRDMPHDRGPPAKPPATPAPAPAPIDSPEALELEADDLLIELEADVNDGAEIAPVSATAPSPDTPIEQRPAAEYPPLTPSEALTRMAEATERGDIATAVMGFAAGMFDVASLMLVRDNLALGWKCSGAPGHDRIDCVLVPLDAPSMFQAAVTRDDQAFHDAPAPSTVHQYFFKVLRVPQPTRATVTVVSIGRRVVNLLYGHRSIRPELTDGELTDVKEVTRAAAAAYVRLIALSKGK